MTSLAKLRQKLLTDPEVKAEYDRLGPIFAVVGEMIEARQAAGLTQTEIASRMGTSQSVVARLENARHMPLCGRDWSSSRYPPRAEQRRAWRLTGLAVAGLFRTPRPAQYPRVADASGCGSHVLCLCRLAWFSGQTLRRAPKRRGLKRATVAVARKLSVLLHRLRTDQTEFQWTREDRLAA
jgi:DNA-binding XRE family transcriptional regulator